MKLPDEQILGDVFIPSCEFSCGNVSTGEVVGEQSFLAWFVFDVIESASNSCDKIK